MYISKIQSIITKNSQRKIYKSQKVRNPKNCNGFCFLRCSASFLATALSAESIEVTKIARGSPPPKKRGNLPPKPVLGQKMPQIVNFPQDYREFPKTGQFAPKTGMWGFRALIGENLLYIFGIKSDPPRPPGLNFRHFHLFQFRDKF